MISLSGQTTTSRPQPRHAQAVRIRNWASRVLTSVLLGVAFHAAWVTLFIFASSAGASAFVRATLWVFAPVVTAAGFATGLALVSRSLPRDSRAFTRPYLTALTGCVVGAAALSPIGPMFVGMGALAGGTLATLFRCYADSRAGRWTGLRDNRVPAPGKADGAR